MTAQHEALRLAERIISARDLMWHRDAAAELRRLHALNAELVEALRCCMNAMYGTGYAVADSATQKDVVMFFKAATAADAVLAKVEGKA